MRALAVLAGVLLAVGLVGSVWWAMRKGADVPAAPQPDRPQITSSKDTRRGAALDVPETAEEARRRHYAQQRAPFLTSLASALLPLHASCRTGDDLAVLEVVLNPDAPDGLEGLRECVLRARPEDFGYGKIVILRASPEGSGLRPALVAELTKTQDGRWTTFLR